MNCRRVKKLIPLFIEGDLESRLADRLVSHLDWCGRCNWLADEYRESQVWLRSFTPPEFDEALLDSVKTGVLDRIATSRTRSSLPAFLAQHWSRRQILALSTAVLIVVGMIVVYLYQARMNVGVRTTREVAEQQPVEETPKPQESRPVTGGEAATQAHSQERQPGSTHRKHLALRKPRRASAAATAQVLPLSLASQMTEASAPQTTTVLGSDSDSPGTLRIEIQTSDPMIRIIWFAPKETDLNQPKPATD